MSRRSFEAAAEAAATALGPSRTKDLAGLLARGHSRERALTELATPGVREAVAKLYEALEENSLPCPEAAAYLRGYVAAQLRARDAVQVRTVWSGPSTPAVPVRATAQVLVEVINDARDELLAMTYAARPYPALTQALTEATARGVQTHVVVETLAGARGLLSGREPAGAFAAVPGLRLWHWVRDPGADSYARQHAKLAVADRRVLFLGSANLTESAARRNIEAGVLVRGGDAPQRAAEHIAELQRRGCCNRSTCDGRWVCSWGPGPLRRGPSRRGLPLPWGRPAPGKRQEPRGQRADCCYAEGSADAFTTGFFASGSFSQPSASVALRVMR